MKIKYEFFGKNCFIDRELKNRENLEQILHQKEFHYSKILLLNQIHSNEVIVIDSQEKIYGNQDLPKADAIVTNLKNIAIAVVTADCSPILLFDPEKQIIAATHAGWRGAKLGIISATITMMKKIGAQKISAIIGPMIQQKSYEVSQDFVDDFLTENSINQKFFLKSQKPFKYWFNLSSYVEEKLKNEGLEKIENLKIDTYENEENFFSFRRSKHRDEKDCGRNIAIISAFE
jgi:hypothetical protein